MAQPVEKQVGPGSVVLKGVPYIGPNWQQRLDGPQDFTFPAAMRSVMVFLGGDPKQDYRFYQAVSGFSYSLLWPREGWKLPFDDVSVLAADPAEGVRRSFEAAGHAYEIIGNKTLCEARGPAPAGFYGALTAADEIRKRICASIEAGRPVIALGIPEMGGASVIAGYEQDGKTLVGWAGMCDDEAKLPRDASGYVRMEGVWDKVPAIIVVGEKRPAPPIEASYRKALIWAVQSARTPVVGGFRSGLDAYAAWSEALSRDADLKPDDLKALRERHMTHFLTSLWVAEGRAFGGEVLERMGELKPEAAAELHAAANCHWLMHDLVWCEWRTVGDDGPEDDKMRRFASPPVRQELRRIIMLQRDLEVMAVHHMEKALLAMGEKPEEWPAASQLEKDVVARETERARSSGTDGANITHENMDLAVAGVPLLQWKERKDCTFVGALEAALAGTACAYSYTDLMGYSGLAFRTRWFHNPTGAATKWGAMRWHPVSPHGEGPEEIAALSRATGWQFRVEECPQDASAVRRQHLATDATISLHRGLPVVVGHNTDLAVAYGYNIHAANLFLRDYQQATQKDFRIPGTDPSLQTPFVFLETHVKALAPREALLEAARIAVRNGTRARVDGFTFGLPALSAWQEDLAGYEAYSPQERELLFLANWWSLMHLYDARQAAAEFLQANADLLAGPQREALLRAQALYRQEADLLKAFTTAHGDFLQWWGGVRKVGDWTPDVRAQQQELLQKVRDLDEQALKELVAVTAL